MSAAKPPRPPTLSEDARARAKLLTQLADALPDLLAYFDQNTYKCLLANRGFAQLYGYTTDSIEGVHGRDIIGTDSWALVKAHLENARSGKPQMYQQETPTRDGNLRQMQVRLIPHMNAAGQQDGVLVLLRDIALRSPLESSYRENEAQQQKFAYVTQEAVVLHHHGRIVDANEAMMRLTGYSLDELRGTSVFQCVAPGDRAKAMSFAQHPGEVVYEVSLIHRDGHAFDVEVNTMPLPGHGEDHRMVVVRDLRLRKTLQQRELFLYDALTELPNRRALLERLEVALEHARNSAETRAVVAVNLDHFKTINDSLGHAAGDQLLREVAQRLLACVGTDGFVARTEGDTFVLVLSPSVHRSYDAMAQQVLEAVAQPTEATGTRLLLSASAGVALFPQHATTAAALVRQAEAAQLLAKQSGRGNHQFSPPDLSPPPMESLRLEYELRSALQSGALLLHYQPMMELASGRIAGVEALVRWQHPTRGLLPPSAFIGLAETHGLIARIGRWVLGEACRQAKRWQEQGLRDLSVSVNVSALEFRQRDIAREIGEVLLETGLDARLLEIELTESVLIHHSEALVHALHAIKNLGVRIAIDDFGTGYSSLAYLKRYPLDKLKIDRAFVVETPHNEEDVAIVTAVVQLAHSLQLQIVAEGVGSEAQQQLLTRLGCDFSQGYWLSQPLPADDATQWLQARAASPPLR